MEVLFFWGLWFVFFVWGWMVVEINIDIKVGLFLVWCGFSFDIFGGLKWFFFRCRGRWSFGVFSARIRKDFYYIVWRCEGRENECRGDIIKDLVVSVGKKISEGLGNGNVVC